MSVGKLLLTLSTRSTKQQKQLVLISQMRIQQGGLRPVFYQARMFVTVTNYGSCFWEKALGCIRKLALSGIF